MAETDVNIINHLLDVEHQASEMITGAQAEADKRIASSRAQAEAEYKKEYEALISSYEADYAQRTKAFAEKHAQEISTYKSDVEHTAQDTQAFNKLLASVLSAE